MVDSSAVGARIRRHRRAQGNRPQAAIANLCGITEEYLSQIERGLKTPSLQVLHALAAEIGVPVAAFLADEPPTTPGKHECAVAPGVSRALMGYGRPASAATCAPTALRERVEAAWRIWQTGTTRFTDAATVLPDLILDVEHAVRARRTDTDPQARRETLRAAADLYALLRSYCRRAGRVDLSLLAADRAARAAEEADDPVRMAVAQWNLGHVLLADGDAEGAEEIALHAAEQVPETVPEAPALCGALELVAVVAASRRRDWPTARGRLRGRADTYAQQAGEGDVGRTVFGPTNVALHALSIEMEAGEAATALRVADQIGTAHLPLERRFTFTLEVARCYDLRREDAAVLVHLLDVAALAPEDFVRSPLAVSMLTGLRDRVRPTYRRQVEALADRLGVP